RRYKPWMRTTLTLWWAVILIGVGTYYEWYIAGSPKAAQRQTSAPTQPAPETINVKISNFKFEPKESTIKAGSSVEWTDEGGRHTVEADDGSFKSETMTVGGRFTHKFDTPGVYPYFCTFHGEKH